jgi:hypothetical protein
LAIIVKKRFCRKALDAVKSDRQSERHDTGKNLQVSPDAMPNTVLRQVQGKYFINGEYCLFFVGITGANDRTYRPLILLRPLPEAGHHLPPL